VRCAFSKSDGVLHILSPALFGWRLAQGVQVQARRCSVKFYRQPGLTLDRELAMVEQLSFAKIGAIAAVEFR
jgi:hypothetical protein